MGSFSTIMHMDFRDYNRSINPKSHKKQKSAGKFGTTKPLEGFSWTCFAPEDAKTGFLKRKNSKATIETGKFREFATVVTTSFALSTQLF